MRIKHVLVAALAAAFLFVSEAASGAPGPQTPPPEEAGTRWFVLQANGPGGTPVWDRLFFTWRTSASADGWDWGGRRGYVCGFVELVVGGRVVAELILQQWDRGWWDDGDGLYGFVDSGGAMGWGGDEDCGRPRVAATGPVPSANELERSRSIEPGMPTAPLPHATGHVIEIKKQGTSMSPGALLASVSIPHASTWNADTWWFRGDEPGELMLWYRNPATGEYGIIERLSCVPLVPAVSCSDYLVYGTDDA